MALLPSALEKNKQIKPPCQIKGFVFHFNKKKIDAQVETVENGKTEDVSQPSRKPQLWQHLQLWAKPKTLSKIT